MTHDDLLAQVTKTLESYIKRRRDSKRNAGLREYVIGSLQALQAVVNLHKPIEIVLPSGIKAQDCLSCEGKNYPCETIDTIEKELG